MHFASLRVLSLVLSLVTAAALSRPVAGDVLGFNDLGPTTAGTHMPTSYGGLIWLTSDWHYLSAPSNNSDIYLALAGNATLIRAENGGDFYLDGAEFWSRRGADANGDFYFVLYHDGVTVYDGLNDPDGRQRFSGLREPRVPNYTGPIDAFALAFDSGRDDWNHLALDNLRIRLDCRAGCLADLNCSGTLTVQDIFDFFEAYFSANVSADMNTDGAVTVQDVFDYLAAYFSGCL